MMFGLMHERACERMKLAEEQAKKEGKSREEAEKIGKKARDEYLGGMTRALFRTVNIMNWFGAR